ncbi:hypothetical protein FTX61_11370 [Nitriliruptoraceae bacterium ZYF776]|nr:hypothetical protein [Profundirhabdus halotolerans]
MNRRSALVPITVLLVTALGLVGLDLAATDPDDADVVAGLPVGGGVPASGGWTCAVGDDREGTDVEVEVVRPDASGDGPATVELEVVDGGGVTPVALPRLFPGAATRTDVEVSETGAATARWFEGPATVNRSWRLTGDEGDLPPGTVAGPCAASTAATTWTVPGMRTSGGSEARLRLANPHGSAATVSIRFLTPDGVEDPTVLRNVSVPARGTVEVPVNDFLPEQDDLAAVVDVLSGRVALEGVQLSRSAIGGIDGASLLAAATAPAETWTVPWVVDGDDRASWLWVVNPSSRTAPLELTLHTPDGGTPPEGLAEVTVPPNTVRRVDLRGTFPEDATSAAVTVRSDGVPVLVSGAAELQADEPEDTGFAVQLGTPELDRTWVVAGGATQDRADRLRLVNPGSEPAVIDVSLYDGGTVRRPVELADVEVPPGALVSLDLTSLLDDAASWAATIVASTGELVVGHVGQGDPDGPLHLVAGPGAPSSSWLAPDAGLRAVEAPGTTRRLGTPFGVRPASDPLPAVDEDEDAPDGTTPEEPATDDATGSR